MRNPLQEQLLKAGLVKKSKLAEAAREQANARHGKAGAAPSAEQIEADQIRQEKAERDRALSAERNAQARRHEQRAQIRQIVEFHQLKREGEIAYAFADLGVIRNVLVTNAVRRQLAAGALVIVRHESGHAVLPRAAADKVRARDPSLIVVDHANTGDHGGDADDDGYYSRFKVPDDLIW
ncbi:MAG TPA: DUF2058 domain-containing protein [Pseudoxanthomonas sp.]|nr:DUF2058 domain-containing protein [Pseudoxanthomonas sp.]